MKLPEREIQAPRAPPGCVIYAIGDVHGRLDLLSRVTGEIEARAAAPQAPPRTVAVFLGDYIDRGPHSAEVIAHLVSLAARAPCELIFLRGNHEQTLLDVVHGRESGARWFDYGGRETLASYGADAPPGADPPLAALQAAARRAIPADHLAFLEATEFYRKLGGYIFVHAGMRPDRLIEEQSQADMLWMRHAGDEPPLWSETVVHGHSPRLRPLEGPWDIGIDTGAHDTGALTMLRLEGAQRRFLKVVRSAGSGTSGIGLWEAVDRPASARRPPLSSRRTTRVRRFKDTWTE